MLNEAELDEYYYTCPGHLAAPVCYYYCLPCFCATYVVCQDDGRVVTLLGRFAWQKEDEQALVKLTATPLSFNGED